MPNLAPRILLPRLFERGQAETPTLVVYSGASPAIPTAAGSTYTLTDGDGNTVVSGAVSVSSEGVASFAVGGAFTTALEYSDRWLEEWALVFSGVTHRIRSDAMLVRRKLYNVVTQIDLLRLHPQLVAEQLPPELEDFTGQIEEAFEEFNRALIEKGNRPHLILSPWSARGCVAALALSYVYRDAMTNAAGDTDRFEKLAKFYADAYESKFPKLTYRVDEEQDGTVSERRPSASPVIFLSSTPRAGRSGLSDE